MFITMHYNNIIVHWKLILYFVCALFDLMQPSMFVNGVYPGKYLKTCFLSPGKPHNVITVQVLESPRQQCFNVCPNPVFCNAFMLFIEQHKGHQARLYPASALINNLQKLTIGGSDLILSNCYVCTEFWLRQIRNSAIFPKFGFGQISGRIWRTPMQLQCVQLVT